MRASGANPLVTHVGSDGRTELSATSVANAAAKIANALLDECDCAPGDVIVVALPPHWQRTCWLAGAWLAGVAVAVVDDPTKAAATAADVGAVLVVVGSPDAAQIASAPCPVAAVSLHPLGLPQPVPDGAVDASALVRVQPDAFLGVPADGSAPAFVDATGAVHSQDDLLAMAAQRAADWGLVEGGRLRVDPSLRGDDAWLAVLAVPLAARAAVVIAVEADGVTERVTASVPG